jgi:hypothetical protein
MVTWKEGPIVSALLLAEIQASNVNLYGIFFKIVFNCSYLYVFQKFFLFKRGIKTERNRDTETKAATARK